jgi:protein O-GlcNAc transferase
LAHQPKHAAALSLLGSLTYQTGRLQESEGVLRQAIEAKPDEASHYFNLGAVLLAQGRLEEAVAASREALRLGQNGPGLFCNLGLALLHLGRLDEAIECFDQAVAVWPDSADLRFHLGNALLGKGRLQQAAESFHLALAIKPNCPDALTNLGTVLERMGHLDEAVKFFRQAISVMPRHAAALNNLGKALRELGKLDEALDCFQAALASKPDYPALVNLGNVYRDHGRLDEAIVAFRQALAIMPDSSLVRSALLYALPFQPDCDAATIYAEHCLWNQRHALPLRAAIQPHRNDRNPERPLRIGYVSPYFCAHPVGRLLLPLLENHDRRDFETYCYSGVQHADEFANRLRACSACWRATSGLSDAQTADLIRQDGVDILVDLALHMAGTRLLVFARKPSPVQVTYLGYCGTTGLDAIDYRITDPYLDPPESIPLPGATMDGRGEVRRQTYYSERSMYLPHTYWCYQAPAGAPEPGPPSAVAAGHVTFGCLNNFCKVSRPAMSAWCRLLRDVPDSRLLLHSLEGSHRQRVHDFLAGEGIDPRRLGFVGSQPMRTYLDTYRGIDIALDPFPYNGGTTTCDALWMGVPVVSLAGRTAVGRAGLSLLSNVGLPELVAHTEEEYVETAADLASDLPRLAELRSTLRQRMLASPLMDAPAFARDMEAAYRQMWRAWCTGETGII